MTNGIRNALLFGGGALVAALAVAYGLGAFTPAPVEKVAQTAQPAGNSTTAQPAGNSTAAQPDANAMTAKEGRVPSTAQKPAGDEADAPAAAPSPQAEADQPAPNGDAAADGSPAAAPAQPTGNAAAETGAATSKETAETKDVTAPSFDVVRVEGNGSMVVAGHSAPGAKVEILSGKSVLGASTAGAEGDFAIVLDSPLKPGDYQLVLRSTTPANVVAMSKETAVVSIPEEQSGQVLALVEAPGQPSKLITVPNPDKAAAEAPAPAAPAQPDTAPNIQARQSPPPAASGGGAEQPPAGDAADAGDGQKTVAADTKPSVGGTTGAPAQPRAEDTRPPAQTAKAEVSVEAVEIEGNKIFIAGVAAPGSTVRVYANDMVLGEAKTSPVGRFLVEAIHELAVGDYIIRADMLAPDGLKVAARAAVPFTRAPGESVAAVASGEAGSGNGQNDATAAAENGKAEAADAAPGAAANPKTAPSEQPSANEESNGSSARPGGADGEPKIATNARGSAILPPLDSEISKQPPTVVSPKLRETTGAVIIRRGDTLWQISRRLYGHGIRYSTIYLANQDQIEDPDMIWPGQIFAVPNETKEGETADMKAIAGQATELPTKATE